MELVELSEDEENEIAGGSNIDYTVIEHLKLFGFEDIKGVKFEGCNTISQSPNYFYNSAENYFTVSMTQRDKKLYFHLTQEGKAVLNKKVPISVWIMFCCYNKKNQFVWFKIRVWWRKSIYVDG